MIDRKAIYARMTANMPLHAQNRIDASMEQIGMALGMHNAKVAASMAPSAMRGLIRRDGKTNEFVEMKSGHAAHFDLRYDSQHPEMYDLYRRAVANQWDGEKDLPWHTDVDPENPEKPLIEAEFIPIAALAEKGIKLNGKEQIRLNYHMSAWFLSQFMHGEQGALYASAQVTESVKWMDGKLYGATQVMDEARHLEVFLRYLDSKLNRVYHINDNLFVIIDDLMTDSRWDIKFLGMQIMVEGLALGAFGTIYNLTKEPLLKELLKRVIQDESRHVHYGVLALRDHIKTLSDAERREREDWAFEVAMLMRNRFLGHEIYDEWFAHRLRRSEWNEIATNSEAMSKFRRIMFRRLVPNLREIGLLSPRIQEHYAKEGLMQWADGKDATQLSADDLLLDPDAEASELEAA